MAKAATSLGWAVTVFAPGASCKTDSSHPYHVERMGTRGKQDWLDRVALLRHFRRRGEHTDEQLVIAEPAAVRAMLYSHYFGISFPHPPIVVLHGTEILRLTAFPHRRCLFRRLLNGSRCVHVLSHANRKLLETRLPGIDVPIIVSPGAPSWRCDEKEKPPSSPGGIVTILTVGRIHPRKGQLEALSALSRLPTADQKRIRYRIVGPSVRSRYREKILRLASRCPFPVELPGALDEDALAEEYRAADIFALTSRQDRMSVEGFGLVYLDASANGLPVVATRTGGIPEAVIDGETGLLAEEGSISQLSDCFSRLIRDPHLRQRLGTEGKRHADRHRWESTVERVFASIRG